MQLKRELIESFEVFPFTLPVIQHFQDIVFHPNVTMIIGENGMGKSTLLEGIAVSLGFNPEGGSKNFNFSSYDSHTNLDAYLRIAKGPYRPKDHFFLRAESFYNVATYVEDIDQDPSGGGRVVDSFGGTSLHQQSHGESFFAAFNERFRGNGLYVLDEPEAALSPLRQLSLLSRLDELVHQGSQFVIATHSPMLMAYPHVRILELSEDGLQEKALEETSHYTVMKQFFEDRGRLFYHLFR
ncbi:AAA family ATPase [Gracilibacillus timonensis]|uniref:AAA family ATPase n=1 Tax=Gracilibacillus timonensis TaxID=1816696 RepID=UPI0008267BC7|nr:AAA family ATPase [Gracilibacillus timonensis]